MYQNIVIGSPLVDPSLIFATDQEDWDHNEREKTLFTDIRNLAVAMVVAGVAPSIGEIRRNKPQLYTELHRPNFFRVKWGKNYLHVLVGPSDGCENNDGEQEFGGDPWPFPKFESNSYDKAEKLKQFARRTLFKLRAGEYNPENYTDDEMKVFDLVLKRKIEKIDTSWFELRNQNGLRRLNDILTLHKYGYQYFFDKLDKTNF